jgi:hypothetical protein
VTRDVIHSLPNRLAKVMRGCRRALTVWARLACRLAPIRVSVASYRTSTLPLANCSDTGWRAVLTEFSALAPYDGAAVNQGEPRCDHP